MRERHREAQEHTDKSNQGTNFFIKTIVVFFLHFLFYRLGEERKGCVETKRVGYGHYISS